MNKKFAGHTGGYLRKVSRRSFRIVVMICLVVLIALGTAYAWRNASTPQFVHAIKNKDYQTLERAPLADIDGVTLRYSELFSPELIDVTPLIYATFLGDIRAVAILLERGSDPNEVEHKFGRTAIFLAFRHDEATRQHLVQLLLQYGANPLHRGGIGTTPIELSILRCDAESTYRLILAGAQLEQLGSFDRPASEYLRDAPCRQLLLDAMQLDSSR